MNINNTTLRLTDGCYFPEKIAKSLVLMHFTAGTTAKGAVDYWKILKNGISAPYVVDTDGTIYETYNPEFWSYHLGFKGTHAHDKRSVAIEVVNPGPLVLTGDTLYFWPKNFKEKYCMASETNRYVNSTLYRGYSHFAAFTKAQMDVIPTLVQNICDRFKIPYEAIEDPLTFQPDYASRFNGIVSHSNFRADKYDVGPAFDWSVFSKKVVS